MNQKIHIFTFFQYLTSVINSLKGFIFVIFLSPEAFGIWRTFYTTVNYARYFDLGISTFSYYRGLISKFSNAYIKLIIKSIFILIIPSSLLFSLLGYKYIEVFDLGLVIIPIVFFLCFSVQFYASVASIYKINKNIKGLIIMDVSFASTSLLLSCLFGYFYHLKGILFGMTFSYFMIFTCLFFIERNNLSMKGFKTKLLRFNKRFRTIIPNSFIYFLPGAISVLFINIDLWFGANSVSTEVAGYFALFMGFQILVSIAPSSISTWFYIDDAAGINNNIKKLFKVCSINFLSSLIVALFGLVASYALITFFLQDYLQTLLFIKAIFWTLPFFALRNILVNIIIIRGQSIIFSLIILFLVLFKVYLYSSDMMNLLFFINVVKYFNILFIISIILIIFFSNKSMEINQ